MASSVICAVLPLAAASAGAADSLVRDIGFSLIISGILCVVFTRLRIPSIAAFLAAGLVIGPQLGAVVTDRENIETIAGLGLTLMLFVIGLEMNVKKLLASGRTLILTGLLQFPLCVAFGWIVMYAAGLTGWGPAGGAYVPLYAGFAIACSSTLILVNILQRKFQMDTVSGRLSLAVLIFQDIWSIVVLAVQANFENPDFMPVACAFAGMAVVASSSYLVARFALPVAFRWIAKSPELMLVAALGWCFAVGAFGSNLGALLELAGIRIPIGISMEMGALIAGVSIASLPYSHEVVSKVGVVRDFFITLFFVGLGMVIPVPDSWSVLLFTLFLVALTLAARILVFFPLMYFTGLDRRNSFVSSVRLAPISEFCLVLAYFGVEYGHVDSAFVGSLIFAFVITALATPLLFAVADPLHDRLGGLLSRIGFRLPPASGSKTLEEGPGAVVILGFHRTASSLLSEMKERRPELLKDVLVIDFNVEIHAEIEALGAKVKYGDISNKDALMQLGADRAKVLVSTIPDEILKGTTNLELTRDLRRMNPKAVIIATALGGESAAEIMEAGANWVVLPRVETARRILPVLDAAFSGYTEELKIGMDDFLAELHERKEALK